MGSDRVPSSMPGSCNSLCGKNALHTSQYACRRASLSAQALAGVRELMAFLPLSSRKEAPKVGGIFYGTFFLLTIVMGS